MALLPATPLKAQSPELLCPLARPSGSATEAMSVYLCVCRDVWQVAYLKNCTFELYDCGICSSAVVSVQHSWNSKWRKCSIGLAGVASIIVYPSVLSSRCYYYYRSSASFNVVRTSLSSRQSPVDCPVVNMIPACTSPYQRRRLHRTRYRVAHFLLTL